MVNCTILWNFFDKKSIQYDPSFNDIHWCIICKKYDHKLAPMVSSPHCMTLCISSNLALCPWDTIFDHPTYIQHFSHFTINPFIQSNLLTCSLSIHYTPIYFQWHYLYQPGFQKIRSEPIWGQRLSVLILSKLIIAFLMYFYFLLS